MLTASDAKEGDQVFRGHLTGYFLLLTVVAAIKGRPTHETLESLRLTLLKIEQNAEPEQDAEALAELKRILLQRIAQLEAAPPALPEPIAPQKNSTPHAVDTFPARSSVSR